MDLQELVRVFNSLPRRPLTQSGLVDNHWHFAIQHVGLNPPGDLLHIMNPGSRFNHCEGPAQILSCSSVSQQADLVLPMLLEGFNNAMNTKLQIPHSEPFAPWSWGTGDKRLAEALEQRLRSAGVREELCTIRVGDPEAMRIEQEEWEGLLAALKAKSTPGPGCSNCKKRSIDGGQKLLLCGGCKKSQYCSKDCQKADWKSHKRECKQHSVSTSSTLKGNNTSSGGTSSLDPLEYYKNIAPKMPNAQSLAREIGLELPGPGGLSTPIRRLVVTGKDSPENIATLVGQNGMASVKAIHDETRIEILLQPPRGSPMYAMAAMNKLDDNCPPWTPRPASAEEKQAIEKIQDMQGIITRHMGKRGVANISTRDMTEILIKNFGAGWSGAMPIYQNALNAMNQNVYVD